MYIFICVLIMALVTYIPRVLPFTIFTKEIKSVYIQSLLHYMPCAVLSAMTFPAVLYSTNNMLCSSIGTMVALFLAYKGKDLLHIAIASVAIIYILNIFFV